MKFEGTVIYCEYGENGVFDVDSGTANLTEYLHEFEGKKVKVTIEEIIE